MSQHLSLCDDEKAHPKVKTTCVEGCLRGIHSNPFPTAGRLRSAWGARWALVRRGVGRGAQVRRASKRTGLLPAAPPPRVAASDSAAAAAAAAACRDEEEAEEPWVVQGLSRDAAAALVTAHLVAHAQALRRAHPASGAPVLTVRRPAPPVLYHFHSDADLTPEPDKSSSSSSVNDSEKAEDIKNMCATFQRVTFRGMKSDHTDVADVTEESKSKKKRDEDAFTDASNADSYCAPSLTKTDGGKAFFPSQIHSVNKERLFHIGGGSNPGATDVIPIPTKLVPNVDHRN